MEESMDRGTSVMDCTNCTALARIAGSSASGIPALTSSIWAPAAICALASDSTREKSPAAISAARILRPVGLMRSPIITKGRSKPMMTSRVAELTTLSVMELSCWMAGRWRVAGGTVVGFESLGPDQPLEILVAITGLETCGFGGYFPLDVLAARPRITAFPICEVGV